MSPPLKSCISFLIHVHVDIQLKLNLDAVKDNYALFSLGISYMEKSYRLYFLNVDKLHVHSVYVWVLS